MNRTVGQWQRWLVLILIAACLLPQTGYAQTPSPLSVPSPTAPAPTAAPAVLPTATAVSADSAALARQVDAILAEMSVADRVGQLFIIGFEGGSAGFDSDIAELIYGYRVGGVVLRPENNNFTNDPGVDTPAQVAGLVNRLQALAYGLLLPADRALDPVNPASWPPPGSVSMEQVTSVPPINLPLLIAVEQSGDGLPATALRRGFTPLPSPMAMGAAWNPELAYRIGQITGRELSAVGVNMLLGPNLDVLDQPRIDRVGTLGLQTFGGDPDWVSQMGRAYIAGVHVGSSRAVATFARHFPGAGDADRLPDQEVATVQRSMAELERITLPPFLAVTRSATTSPSAEGDPAVTDGMMSSHIRYSAIQGSSMGRNTPISLAPELAVLMARPGLAEWRAQGGLLISNMLGAPAIRRHYDPTLREFPYRRVAMDAFTAGHDLLYLDQFSLDDTWESEKRNIKETIGFFQERYTVDPDFAAQVDAAIRRILTVKLRLYGAPALQPNPGEPPVAVADLLIDAATLERLRSDAQAEALIVVGQVARESFTLLYPDPNVTEMATALPQTDDQILIITDSRQVRECATCPARALVGPDELASIIVRLYGPTGTGQLRPEQLSSITFDDLTAVMEDAPAQPSSEILLPTPTTALPRPTPDAGDVSAATRQEQLARTRMLLDGADWIIFAMLDIDTINAPSSDAVKTFLRQPDIQRANRRIVVLALHAPYFLDATEISKLTGYYGVYGKTQPFLESAIRALFRAYTPNGAPPVSVAGTRFASLADRLSPDPTQPIDLLVLGGDGRILAGEAGSAGAELPSVEAGTLIRIQAGPILDRNGRPVRNGTGVEIAVVYEDDPTVREVETAATRNGVAARDLVLSRAGVAQISARAGGAASTELVALSVQGGTPAVAAPVVITQTAPVSVALLATTTLPSDTPPVLPLAEARLSVVSLAVALLTMLATLGLILIVQVRILPRKMIVHSLLWAINCGLAAYILYGLGLIPGGSWLHGSLRVWGTGLVVFIAMLMPLVWLELRTSE
jgi:beta-N-acetylhexosaminidase